MREVGKRLRKAKKRKAIFVIGPSIAYLPLTQGLFAVLDADVARGAHKFNWSVRRRAKDAPWYAVTVREFSDGSSYVLRLHDFAAGRPEEGMRVDHIDPNRTLDNRRANLRHATREQNARNTRKLTPGTSKLKGVSFDKSRNRWIATIRVDGKYKRLGRFTDETEAHAAYCEAALKYFGSFARFE